MIYLLFTPLFYINNTPHVGHALNLYITRSLKRLLYLQYKVSFLISGTDEHGEKVHKSFLEHNIVNKTKLSLKEYINHRRDQFNQQLFSKFNVDVQWHTDTIQHSQFVQSCYQHLMSKKLIIPAEYVGYYNLVEEKYIDDLTYSQLTEEQKKDIITKRETGFKFILEQSTKESIIDNLDNILLDKHYHEYAKQVIQNGKDVFITRDLKVCDNFIKTPDGQYNLYVWFDALLYYLHSTLSYNQEAIEVYLVIGKDILEFHISLLQHLQKHITNKFKFKIITHPLININEEKISKSKNNGTAVNELYEKYGDVLLAALITSTKYKDIEFSEQTVKDFINFMTNSVRNCYKRMYKLLPQYQKTTLVESPKNAEENRMLFSTLEQLQRIVVQEPMNHSSLMGAMINAVTVINTKITEYALWEVSDEKSQQFFILMNYIRFTIGIEFVFNMPGIDKILEETKTPHDIFTTLYRPFNTFTPVSDIAIFNFASYD